MSNQPNIQPNWTERVNTSIRLPAMFGTLVLVLFGGGFTFWAATAPISGAAVAPGIVAAAGQNQIIQHLEGGIVAEISVREGDRVIADQPLMVLDKTAAEATRNRLSKLLIALQARAARLVAERDGAAEFTFSDELVKRAENDGLQNTLDEQQREFAKRIIRQKTELNILVQRSAALGEQIRGFIAQRNATLRQLDVVGEDLERKIKLLKRGLTNRSQVTRLQRNEAELSGRLGGFTAEVGRARAAMVESVEQREQLRARRAETAVTALNQVQREITDIDERLRAAVAVLGRIVIRAPSDGIIVRLNKNSRGSVVRGGEEILEILPTSNEFIVEARVSPLDIDAVSVGQSANLRFSALNQRTTPEVPATITYISADRLIDPVTRESYYLARLKIADNLPPTLDRARIFPGMPVEAYIKTGDRTFVQYIVRPIQDSFSRAFREE